MLATKEKRVQGYGEISREREKKLLEQCSSMLRCLPDVVLSEVAFYLTESSQMFLAAAVSLYRRPIGTVTIQWTILDFSDLDKEVQSRLTDDDLNSVLCNIDATNTLRTLKLPGCINITGRGLGVLRGAVNLCQIDLSLVGQRESPVLVSEPSLSQAVVVPILNSIVGKLRHIQLPKQWRIQSSPMLQRFLNNYNNCLNDRCVTCSGERCVRSPPDGVFPFMHVVCNEVIGQEQWMNESGLQNFTCYECNDNFCFHCSPEFCGTCDKMLCDECCPVNICITCDAVACEECKQMKFCDGCNETRCIDCFIETCGTCNETLCGDCGVIKTCISCDQTSCGDCGTVVTCAYCRRFRCVDCCPILVCEGWGCSEMNCIECSEWRGKVKWCELCDRSYCFDCRYDEYINSEAGFCEMCQSFMDE